MGIVIIILKMFISIKFLLFFFWFFLLGRGLTILFKNKDFQQSGDNLKVFSLPVYLLYPIFGMIFMGNITFLINYFYPISNRFIILLSFVLVLLNIKIKPNIKLNFTFSLLSIFTLLYLPLSSYNIGLSYDAGLYHLNYQKWIQSSKLVIGLSNLHIRYGYSSIFDYIASNLWMNNNFIFIHFLNLTCLSTLFIFLLYSFLVGNDKFLKGSSVGILIFGLLDNFGFNGGKNGFIEIEGVTKYDSVFGSIFYLTVILSFLLILKKNITVFDFQILFLLAIFNIQMRPTGILVLIPIFITLVVTKKIKIIIFDKVVLLGGLILSLWLLKNLLISGCIIFPVEFLCFDSLPWYQNNYAFNETENIRQSLRAFSLNMGITDWFEYWSQKNEYNFPSLINFLISYLIIYVYKLLFYKSKINLNFFISLIFTITLIAYWFYLAPDNRFGIPFFMVAIGLIFSNVIEEREIKRLNYINKYLTIFLFSFCVLLTPRIDSIILFLNGPFEDIKISQPNTTKYIARNFGYGFFTSDKSEQCWINIDCSPDYSLPTKKTEFIIYNGFIPMSK